MRASTCPSEEQRHHQLLGELVHGLLSLETAVRSYLCVHELGGNFSSWKLPTDFKYGEEVPEDAFTGDRSFGDLIKAYNATLTTKSSIKKYQIDESIVSTRNTVAHGRLLSGVHTGAPMLVSFSRPIKKTKQVSVTAVINVTDDWLRARMPIVAAHVAKIQKKIQSLLRATAR